VIGLLIFATIFDLLLAVLLIAVSGFIFGGGPEGMNGDPSGAAMWVIGLVAALSAPIGGFMLWRFGRPGTGAAVAWLPSLFALALTFWPDPY
jgi:hypothetical protein